MLCMYTQLTKNYMVTTGGKKRGMGVEAHTFDRYGEPIPL